MMRWQSSGSVVTSKAANHVLFSATACLLAGIYILESHKVQLLPLSCLTSTSTIYHHHQLV